MSITLNLSPELEAQLRADAQKSRLSVEILAVQKLSDLYLDQSFEKRQRRLEALESLGAYDTRTRAGLAPTTERDDERSAFYDDGRQEP